MADLATPKNLLPGVRRPCFNAWAHGHSPSIKTQNSSCLLLFSMAPALQCRGPWGLQPECTALGKSFMSQPKWTYWNWN